MLEPMQRSEDQLRVMIDEIPALVWSCRPDGTVDFCNQRWLDYTGISFEQARGSGWKVSIHPEDADKLLETWSGILTAGQPGEIEARVRRFDGEYRWFLLRALPVRDEHGEIVKWLGTNTDIEDQKRGEFLLAAEKRTLEMISGGSSLSAILEDVCSTMDAQAPDVVSSVLLMDPDGVRLRTTAGSRLPPGWAKAIDGVEIGPCVGSCGTAAFLRKQVIVSDIAHDPLWAQFRDLALSYGLRAAWSQPLISKANKVLGTFGISYTTAPRVPTDGDLQLIDRVAHLALIAIEADQSRAALTKALDEIRNSETQLRTTIDAMPTQVWSALPDGSIDFVSRGWLDFHGLSLREAMERGWERVIHPEDLAGIVDKWRSALAAGEPSEHEARDRTAGGGYRWCLTRIVPMPDEAGNIVKWYGTTNDIDDRKRAEEQRAALGHELESERDRLRLLLDVQKALVANLDLPSLFKQLAASLRRVTECDFIGLAFPDPASGNLREHFVDFPEGRGVITEGLMIPLNGTANGKAFRTRQLVCLESGPDGQPDPDIYNTPAGERFYQLIRKEGIPAGYLLPLVSGDQVIAVLQLMHYSGARLKSQEAEFLSALASQLSVAVANAIEHGAVVASRDQLTREQVYLREEIDRSSMFEEIVGSSLPLRKALSQVRRVAPGDSTILVLGETGTGKELIARAIHKQSRRSTGPFVRVNCATIPQTLIASELFGHERGAFTGATQRRLGRFESADGGTIFLDEVGELPPESQVALLRVLQEREIERLGNSQPIKVDVRVLAATNVDLNAAVAAGTFRRDLFYRLNVVPIYVPALRERVDDIPVLVEYLIERYSRKAGKRIRAISQETLRLFKAYDWPGNVRELQNVVERAVVLSEGETFTVDETWLRRQAPGTLHGVVPLLEAVAEREKELIEAALSGCRGQVGGPAGAAAKLGVPRQTLESRIASLQIDKYRFKSAKPRL